MRHCHPRNYATVLVVWLYVYAHKKQTGARLGACGQLYMVQAPQAECRE
ncbi:hypothetical protein U128_05320 [Anaplasma marginale str. Gypsy Plains]|nr:hypothetical protein U128_05320 [Anaplasma marginale str. Gypsy Plains]